MRLFKQELNWNFLKHANIAIVFSAVLILGSLTTLIVQGLNFGLDFTGGTKIDVTYTNNTNLKTIRAQLVDAGYGEAVVQNFGTAKDVTIRLGIVAKEGVDKAAIGNKILDILKADGSEVVLKNLGFVSATIGEELTEQGILAIVVMLICIMLYVTVRFEWKFSVGAVAALAHDVIITLGVFSLLQLDFDLTVLAAVLAVIGYSLNDTIVVYDRIRENFLKLRKADAEDVINKSINQTFARTLITSGTTLFVLIALFVVGGQLIHGFATALLVGIFVGTYSSIYVASFLALKLGVCKEDLMPTEIVKEGADQESQI
jgi:preprotein translocase subunit SecF